MKYIVGMDGGGTKTHCIITNRSKEILYECSGGPSNFLMIGTEAVSNTIFNLITECTNYIKINYSDIDIILLGTTGAGRRSDAEKLQNDFLAFAKTKGVELNNFYVDSDARIALEGAFSGKPGSILIAGTGSIMFGKDAQNKIHRTGGFGRYIGDEGSGYSIGRKALIAVAKDLDERGSSSLLTKMVIEKFKLDSPEKLITEVYTHNFNVASAAPFVLEAAAKNDPAALAIIETESDELVLHAAAMEQKIKLPTLNVSLIGGLISNENIYSQMLRYKMTKHLPNIIIKNPEKSPSMGAVILAETILQNLH